uniref:Retrotransposon gag domain-containing protein n=1 Tax=Tanacetum cinerariifolium TaxID=118510 RepID=A0A6L2JZA8_TANCI|nr:hypothetical protein [Tanacetum cinerariifolium]
MAGENIDNLTMEQYLTLTRGNQARGVVRPEIGGNVNFEIKSQFIRELREDTFLRNKNNDAHEHIERVLDVVCLFNILGVARDAVVLCVFPITLTGATKRWVDRLTSRTISTWDLLKKAFIQRYYPPSKTAKQLEDIRNFNQEGEKTLNQAWERYNDLLYKCLTHDINRHRKTMADHSEKWHDSLPSQSLCNSNNSEGMAFILCDGPHLDKECPLNKDAKSVEEVKNDEGHSSPFIRTKDRVGTHGYYTGVDNRLPFGEKNPSLEELINKHLEESARSSSEMELMKEDHAKVATEVPTLSVGQCKAVYDDAPINKASSKKAIEIHEVSFIDKHEDDNLPSKDLGASINVMSKSMFEHLKLANLKEMNMLVEMADMTKKNTLVEYMILSGTDNRPPMLDKDLVIRTNKYAELSTAKKIQADCDMKATNIILQGLLADIYSLVNHHRVAKDLWERVYLPPEWSKFVTDVKLVKDFHTSNYYQLHAYLEQHELHANEVRLMRERNQDPLALIANQQMTPPQFNFYQSSYNNPQLQPEFSPSHYGSNQPLIYLSITTST